MLWLLRETSEVPDDDEVDDEGSADDEVPEEADLATSLTPARRSLGTENEEDDTLPVEGRPVDAALPESERDSGFPLPAPTLLVKGALLRPPLLPNAEVEEEEPDVEEDGGRFSGLGMASACCGGSPGSRNEICDDGAGRASPASRGIRRRPGASRRPATG